MTIDDTVLFYEWQASLSVQVRLLASHYTHCVTNRSSLEPSCSGPSKALRRPFSRGSPIL